MKIHINKILEPNIHLNIVSMKLVCFCTHRSLNIREFPQQPFCHFHTNIYPFHAQNSQLKDRVTHLKNDVIPTPNARTIGARLLKNSSYHQRNTHTVKDNGLNIYECTRNILLTSYDILVCKKLPSSQLLTFMKRRHLELAGE